MMTTSTTMTSILLDDHRLYKAIELFNSRAWYSAHDLFEELWHETYGFERNTLQAFLQIAVAQLHLECGNTNGAILLYGEALGRLENLRTPDLGFDIEQLCKCVNQRLKLLHQGADPGTFTVPFILKLA